jgi:broad specificity phosphatase PhoE
MKPINIILIRHGESHGNVDNSIYKTIPDWKIELTAKGKKQAKEAAKNILKIDDSQSYQFYVSPWIRTRQTASIIIDELKKQSKVFPQISYQEDPRLREQEWGNYQEDHLVSKIEKERKNHSKFFYRIPYGESGADVYDRISTFLETMHRDFEKKDFPDNVVIVSHGLTILTFLMRWLHWSPEEFDNLKTPQNCQVIRLSRIMKNDYYLLNQKFYLTKKLLKGNK